MDPRSVISTSGHPTSFNSPKSRMLRKSLEFMDFRAGKRRGRRVKRSMKTTAQSLPEAVGSRYTTSAWTTRHGGALLHKRGHVESHAGPPVSSADDRQGAVAPGVERGVVQGG
eukprot:scaffold4179_cov108-Isochrysis_galbana.AAC.2